MIERKNKRYGRIGVFAVAHATYWGQFPGLLDNIMKYHADFISMLKENDVEAINSVTLCGLCTDICVISNAMLIKSALLDSEIVVDSNCSAGVTIDSHLNALNAMKSCQIKIV